MSRFLALDQALKISGWAIFDNNELVECGTFSIPATKTIEERLNLFMQQLYLLNKEYNFSEVYFEDIQNQQNNETYKKLAYVQAATMIWCYNKPCKFTILAPSHWRSILKQANDGLGFGRARVEQKQKAIEFVKNHFDRDVSSDEADAICLGYAGWIEKLGSKNAW